MENKATTNNEVLILADQEGNLFVIPREIVESYRASAGQRAEIEELLGQEVTGFQMPSDFLMQKMAEYHERDRRDEGARERMANAARAGKERTARSSPSPRGETPHPTGVGGLLTGIWRRLSKPAPVRHVRHARRPSPAH